MTIEEFVEKEIKARWNEKNEEMLAKERENEIATPVGESYSLTEDFSSTVKNSVLKVTQDKEQVKIALDYIFSGIKISEPNVVGNLHSHGTFTVECSMDIKEAYALARNPKKLHAYLKRRN